MKFRAGPVVGLECAVGHVERGTYRPGVQCLGTDVAEGWRGFVVSDREAR